MRGRDRYGKRIIGVDVHRVTYRLATLNSDQCEFEVMYNLSKEDWVLSKYGVKLNMRHIVKMYLFEG